MRWADTGSEVPRQLATRCARIDTARCLGCPVRPFAICGAVPLDHLDHLSAGSVTRTVRAHHVLFLEGDPADHFFVLRSGVAKLYKQLNDGRQQITGFAMGGDLIGLRVRDRHIVTAEALIETTFCTLRRARMRELFAAFPELEERLMGIVSHELSLAQDQLLLLGRRTAIERLACFLLLLSHRAAERGQPTTPLALPMTRADMADYLGLKIETVSRTFTRLARDGVIRLINPHLVDLVRRDELNALSEGGILD